MKTRSPSSASRMEAPRPLGRIAVSPNATGVLTRYDLALALCRHSYGDWGDVSNREAEENEQAVRIGAAVYSRYRSSEGIRFVVYTPAERRETFVVLSTEV